MDNNALVKTHKELVYNIARNIYNNYKDCPCLEFQDVLSMGYHGLLDSAKRFNNTDYENFSAFAHKRIRGSMIDGINKFNNKLVFIKISDEQFDKIQERNPKDAYLTLRKKESVKYINYTIKKRIKKKDKHILYYRFKKGLKLSDISRKLNVSPSKISKSVNKSINTIRKDLISWEDEKRKKHPNQRRNI